MPVLFLTVALPLCCCLALIDCTDPASLDVDRLPSKQAQPEIAAQPDLEVAGYTRTLLQQGGEEAAAQTAERARQHRLRAYHGWCMAACFAFVLPLGIVIAVGFKHSGAGGRWWPYLHGGWQIIGWLLALAGVGIAAKLTLDNAPDHIHRAIGITVEAMLGLQVLVSVVRPGLTSRIRRAWNVVHWYNGRLLVAVAIGNLYYGLYLTHPGTRYFVGLSVCLGGIVFIAFCLEMWKEVRKPPPGEQDAFNAKKMPTLEMSNGINGINGHSATV